MVNRFDVFLVNLDATPSDDAKNTRPGVVISPDESNRNIDHVIIAPVASTNAKYPTRVGVEFLNSERFVILDQMRAVDKARLLFEPAVQQPVLDQPRRTSAPRIIGAHPQPAVRSSDDSARPGIADLEFHYVFRAADSAHDTH